MDGKTFVSLVQCPICRVSWGDCKGVEGYHPERKKALAALYEAWKADQVEDWQELYLTCRQCNKPVDFERFLHACNSHQQMTCGVECHRKEIVSRHACCENAVILPCVCMYAFHCEEHGDTHIGSHD